MNELKYNELIKSKVDKFDQNSGIGYLTIEDRQVWFHCISITDGSRFIENGSEVVVLLRVGRNGQPEAYQVQKIAKT